MEILSAEVLSLDETDVEWSDILHVRKRSNEIASFDREIIFSDLTYKRVVLAADGDLDLASRALADAICQAKDASSLGGEIALAHHAKKFVRAKSLAAPKK